MDKVTPPNRAAGLAWSTLGGTGNTRSPTAILIGGGGETTLNPSQGWRDSMCHSPTDTTHLPIGYGSAVTSAVSLEGWCAGIFSASKVTNACKVFVAVYSLTGLLHIVPMSHVEQRRTSPADGLLAADQATMADMQRALQAVKSLKTASAYYSASQRAVKALEERTPGGRRAASINRSSSGMSTASSDGIGEMSTIDPAARASDLTIKQLRAVLEQLGHKPASRATKAAMVASLASIRGEVTNLSSSDGSDGSDSDDRGGGGRGRGGRAAAGGGGSAGRRGNCGGRGRGRGNTAAAPASASAGGGRGRVAGSRAAAGGSSASRPSPSPPQPASATGRAPSRRIAAVSATNANRGEEADVEEMLVWAALSGVPVVGAPRAKFPRRNGKGGKGGGSTGEGAYGGIGGGDVRGNLDIDQDAENAGANGQAGDGYGGGGSGG
eukprot:scaffold36325_cov142-Isochrysis_galbana.AAC.1